MNSERAITIVNLLQARRVTPKSVLLESLEISWATLKRDIAFLRDRMNCPVIFDHELGGYRLDKTPEQVMHALPGLWFNERELYGLLMSHQLLSELDTGGTLSSRIQPVMERIQNLLGADEETSRELIGRVRILSAHRRAVQASYFELVGEALVTRRRVRMVYRTRGRGASSERDVSAQRLVHHRNTWYFDAWCHKTDSLRRFAMDAIERAKLLEDAAKVVPVEEVKATMDGGYGIYAGAPSYWARLRFTSQAAQWVSQEEWHPGQEGAWQSDGSYILRVPVAHDTEFIMDVLRHGDQVQVLEPAALRKAVIERLRRALKMNQASL
jgi:predicted DNA-binding transcriptional regulator YafY